jgi:hypothetical protein
MSTILSYNPIAYWPLNELSGLTAINYGSLGAAADGTYSGVTLNEINGPGGTRAGLWGVNDGVNIQSVALRDSFSGNMTILLFARVNNTGVWTDGLEHELWRATSNVPSRTIYLRKSTTNNNLGCRYDGGGALKAVNVNSYSFSDWFLVGYSYSLADNALKMYVNAAQSGSTQTGVLAWDGVLTDNIIGAYGVGFALSWYGYLAHTAIFPTVLTLANFQTIYAAAGI